MRHVTSLGEHSRCLAQNNTCRMQTRHKCRRIPSNRILRKSNLTPSVPSVEFYQLIQANTNLHQRAILPLLAKAGLFINYLAAFKVISVAE